MQLSVDQPLHFGKYEGRTPRGILFGNFIPITSEQQERILNMNVGGKALRDFLFDSILENYSHRTIRVPLPTSKSLKEYSWRLKEVEMIEDFPIQHYARTSRGDKGYIEWMIRETDYFFDPKQLVELGESMMFYPEVLIVEAVRLPPDELKVIVRPEINLAPPEFSETLLNLNREKFNLQIK